LASCSWLPSCLLATRRVPAAGYQELHQMRATGRSSSFREKGRSHTLENAPGEPRPQSPRSIGFQARRPEHLHRPRDGLGGRRLRLLEVIADLELVPLVPAHLVERQHFDALDVT